MTIDASSVLC